MAPSPPRLRILAVGGNAVSAFLSWRLQATNACDVTLVWKANFAAVAQYGISFKSSSFGNERFKPRYVVQNPEDATNEKAAFDYVLLCVKALPDVYNMADIIQSVVTPQHTCILVNTTNALGVEKQLEERFPTNVVLSLVCGAQLSQITSSEFEHTGCTDIWVGPANPNPGIPEAIQNDMSEALAMTLSTGQVDCKVSPNIRQQQYDRMIGQIASQPLSVLFENPILAEVLQKPGVHDLVSETIDELIMIAQTQKCIFPQDFKSKTIQSMIAPGDPCTMYQDFIARRPMEVESFLGAPVQLAKSHSLKIPRLDTLYTILRNINTTNKERPVQQDSPTTSQPPVRNVLPPPPPPVRQSNGPLPPPPGAIPYGSTGNGIRPARGPPMGPGMGPGMTPGMGPNMGPPGRRGPPFMNGQRPPNSFPPRASSQVQRQTSFEENNLDEFSHVVLYDEIPDGDAGATYPDGAGAANHSLRERELMLRERELALKRQQMALRSRGSRRPMQSRHQDFDEEEDEDDFFDPMAGRGPSMPMMDPENFDMMSITSRRTKRTASQPSMRKDPSMRGGFGRPQFGRNRTSASIMSDMPMAGENILDNPMIAFSSNRYGSVDRKEMADESRANSLTANRLQEMGVGGGPYPGPPARRTSRSPGNPFGPPMGRAPGRPSPPNEYMNNGPPRNGRPSPPGGIPAPIAKYPPGQANPMPHHQVEQHIGVSKPYPPPKIPIKSLTGSASASAGSGDSGSANVESEPSAHSSTSSFVPRMAMRIH